MYPHKRTLKKLSFALMITGLIFMAFGFYQGRSMNQDQIHAFVAAHPDRFDLSPLGNDDNQDLKNTPPGQMDHLVEQAHNRPWSALYMAAFFFTGISLGSLFFLGIQHAAQAGWSVVVSRVMEGIASFIPYGGALVLLVLLLNGTGMVHMFHWMDASLSDPKSSNYDELIANKRPFLNIPFYLVRSVVYVTGWTFFMCWMKRLSKKLDQTNSLEDHNKLHDVSVGFISFFAISSMIMGWDWIMSLDPHWVSTLFGWYVLGSYWVSAVAVIALVALYLKSCGHLPFFNDNHLHDLAKYIFATSLLWTYLWFAQFLLYWYGNIPEEVAYFIHRSGQYNYIHFLMLIPNFLLPVLGLMSSKAKRNPKLVVVFASIVLIGHVIDSYNMIMPGSVGGFYGFGMPEIGSLFFVGGGFLFVVFRALSNMKLAPKGNKLFHESQVYEYPF